MRAMPSPTERTVPTSVRSAWPASRPSMRDLRMLVISSGLICTNGSLEAGALGAGHLLAKLFEAVADRGVEDGVAHPDDEAAEDVGLDRSRRARPCGRSARRCDRRSGSTVAWSSSTAEVTCDRAGACSPRARASSTLAPDAEDDRHAVVLDQQLEEVDEDRVGVGDRAVEPVLLLGGREVGREEEHLQLAVARRARRRTAPSCSRIASSLSLLLRDLEERAGVDRGDLLHG